MAGGRAGGQAAAHVTRKSCQPHTVASFQNGANPPNEMMTLEVSRGRPASPWLGTGWTGPVIQGSLELSQKPQQVLRWVGGSRGLWVEAVVQPPPSPLLQLLKSCFSHAVPSPTKGVVCESHTGPPVSALAVGLVNRGLGAEPQGRCPRGRRTLVPWHPPPQPHLHMDVPSRPPPSHRGHQLLFPVAAINLSCRARPPQPTSS